MNYKFSLLLLTYIYILLVYTKIYCQHKWIWWAIGLIFKQLPTVLDASALISLFFLWVQCKITTYMTLILIYSCEIGFGWTITGYYHTWPYLHYLSTSVHALYCSPIYTYIAFLCYTQFNRNSTIYNVYYTYIPLLWTAIFDIGTTWLYRLISDMHKSWYDHNSLTHMHCMLMFHNS